MLLFNRRQFGEQAIAFGIEALAALLFGLTGTGPPGRAPHASGQDHSRQRQCKIPRPLGLMRKSAERETNDLPCWQCWALADDERFPLQRHVAMFGDLR